MPSSPSAGSPLNARQVALKALLQVEAGAYADVALHRALGNSGLSPQDRGLVTELVYGTVRRQRTLDGLITQLGTRSAEKQPPVLRLVLQLGLYQLRYLGAIPVSAAVNTSVELAKANGLGKLSGVVNGLLRQYDRLTTAGADPLVLPESTLESLGLEHSFPDWLVALWLESLPPTEVAQLCQWFNQVPVIDLRVNPQRTTVDRVLEAFAAADIPAQGLPGLPWGLRLSQHQGALTSLPGYKEGWWSVQDASAQLVGYVVDPQPGQLVLDICAAPGGKATHLAELMGDEGTVWACDRTASRLRKVTVNGQRLGLTSLQTHLGDSTNLAQFQGQADRVLVDAPCSGLGTLHRHADARWRQSPGAIADLVPLQQALLAEAARCLKPDGELVYATCTLHPAENQGVVQNFLDHHPDWVIKPPPPCLGLTPNPAGWVQLWPHRHHQDGFFIAKLARA
jgi:16S rRNA (cytosine967-C5)-methyltransferase